jgi:hypothetical protein
LLDLELGEHRGEGGARDAKVGNSKGDVVEHRRSVIDEVGDVTIEPLGELKVGSVVGVRERDQGSVRQLVG